MKRPVLPWHNSLRTVCDELGLTLRQAHARVVDEEGTDAPSWKTFWETASGLRCPPVVTAHRIARGLGISVERAFFGGAHSG